VRKPFEIKPRMEDMQMSAMHDEGSELNRLEDFVALAKEDKEV
jgi:hypothetical protein